MKQIADILAQRNPINMWTILAYAGARAKRHMAWCRCECGEVRRVDWYSIHNGASKNCGCKRPIAQIKHGHSKAGNVSPEYQAWTDMRKRAGKLKCEPKTAANYKDRGISICERWANNFDAFLQDMGARPAGYTLERIDNNGNYEPSNCRWVPFIVNERNKRTNTILEFSGEKKCLSEWAEITGIDGGTIMGRIKRGWTIEDALTVPPSPNGAGMKHRTRHGNPVRLISEDAAGKRTLVRQGQYN